MPDNELKESAVPCGEECGSDVGAGPCTDRCARPLNHRGLHLTADGICAWNRARTWAGPGGTAEFRRIDRLEGAPDG